MSHRSYIQVLAWHQPREARSSTRIPADMADVMCTRMAAERISQSKIRLFSPDSLFPLLKPVAESSRFVPGKLPPLEVANCKFIPPPSWTASHPSAAGIAEAWDWSEIPVSV